jgi:Trypsin-co-occurring domain 1
MTDLVAVPLESGGVVVVEMDHVPAGVVKVRRPGQVVAEAAQTLEAALDSVTPLAESILAKLRKARSQAVSAEFGVKLTAEAGAVIAKTAGECHLKVTLHWKQDDDAGQ